MKRIIERANEDSDDEEEENMSQEKPKFQSAADAKTESTSNDAITSKYSALNLHYFEDPFLKLMFESEPRHAIRKPPIINRGYFARVKSAELFVHRFVQLCGDGNAQILSLGSGMDTLCYRILLNNKNSNLRVFEVDFPGVISRKSQFTMRPSVLSLLSLQSVHNWQESTVLPNSLPGLQLGPLTLLAADLRDSGSLCRALSSLANFDFSSPTLVLTECVLVYVEKSAAMGLVTTLGSLLQQAAWFTYDMINPTDAFGSRMQTNLKAQGQRVPGFTDFPSLESQEKRFTHCESDKSDKEDEENRKTDTWQCAKSISMLEVYNNVISEEERKRVARLEIFDELEEWELIMSHYAITVATKGEFLKSLTDFDSVKTNN